MNNAEFFLDLEKEAVKLSESVKNIYEEIGSYKEAKTDFLKTAKELLLLIEKTDELLISSHSVISKMNDIGMPELLNKIDDVKSSLLEMEAELSKSVNNKISKITLEIEESTRKLSDKFYDDNQQLIAQIVSTEKRNKLNSTLIISSIVLTLVNLVVLIIK